MKLAIPLAVKLAQQSAWCFSIINNQCMLLHQKSKSITQYSLELQSKEQQLMNEIGKYKEICKTYMDNNQNLAKQCKIFQEELKSLQEYKKSQEKLEALTAKETKDQSTISPSISKNFSPISKTDSPASFTSIANQLMMKQETSTKMNENISKLISTFKNQIECLQMQLHNEKIAHIRQLKYERQLKRKLEEQLQETRIQLNKAQTALFELNYQLTKERYKKQLKQDGNIL